MDLIIDVQGFRDSNHAFIAKEVAVVAINLPYIGHWIVRPNEEFSDLPGKVKSQNNWLSRFYHGIEWYDGDVSTKHLHSTLREVTRNAERIFARGKEKTDYLNNLLSREIFNLENVTPALGRLTEEEGVCYCAFHGFTRNGTNICALNNAMKLKIWLEENSMDISEDDDDDDCGAHDHTECELVLRCPAQKRQSKKRNQMEVEANVIEKGTTLEREEEKEESVETSNKSTQTTTTLEENEHEEINSSVEEERAEKGAGVNVGGSEEDINETATTTSSVATTTTINVENTLDEVSEDISTIVSETSEVTNNTLQTDSSSSSSPTPPQSNEYSGNCKSTPEDPCEDCGGLSCGQTAEGVDTVDGARR